MDIVPRAHWGATAPLGPAMALPAREVWIHHSVTVASSNPLADMRAIERVGIERFGRFSYSWAVHPSGTVLEGAGFTVGAHTAGRNSTSFGIVLIGNYEVLVPTFDQKRAVAALIRWLVATGKLQRGAPIGGHRDLKATACPGAHGYAALPEIRSLVSAPDLQEDDMTPAEVTAACTQALKNMTRNINGVGGSADADATWARYVYDAARESLADVDVTPAAVADAVIARSADLAEAIAAELGGSADAAVVETALRRVFADAAAPGE